MRSELVHLEQQALALMNAGQMDRASKLWLTIINEEPSWEHGEALYNLASCYEDLGNLTSAKQCYTDALNYGPQNTIFWGAYASFLYLHGDPREAFEAYIKVLQLDTCQYDDLMVALRTLANKLGLSNQELQDHIAG